MWWHNWRYLPHMKDEALTPVAFLLESLPIAKPAEEVRRGVEAAVGRLIEINATWFAGQRTVLEWLRVALDVAKPGSRLQEPATLDQDSLVEEVKTARGKKNPLSVAELKKLKEEHGKSIVPLQRLDAEARALEGKVAALVNTAYGLTPEEVALMWRTAPPRMPAERPRP
jgi:hypothetical protein